MNPTNSMNSTNPMNPTNPLLRIANIETLYFDRIYALHGLSLEIKENSRDGLIP